MVRLKSLKLEPLFQNKHATNRSCCLYSVAQCRFWCINLQYRTQLHSAIVAFCIVCVDMNDQYLNTSTVNVACSSLIYVICFPTQQGAAYKHYVYSASIVLFLYEPDYRAVISSRWYCVNDSWEVKHTFLEENINCKIKGSSIFLVNQTSDLEPCLVMSPQIVSKSGKEFSLKNRQFIIRVHYTTVIVFKLRHKPKEDLDFPI